LFPIYVKELRTMRTLHPPKLKKLNKILYKTKSKEPDSYNLRKHMYEAAATGKKKEIRKAKVMITLQNKKPFDYLDQKCIDELQ
ncbi:MAG: hypothetical protein ACMXYA_03710, partial [Candidatus Woesearchaeota archaeon]